MATSAALVATRELPRIHIVQDEEKLAQSAFLLLDAYAQRQLTLGELIKRRREELGLTHVQVMDLSGYFLYRSHDLATLERDELKPVHEIWFTILCAPLKLDYNQFFDAYEKRRPQEQVVVAPMLLVIVMIVALKIFIQRSCLLLACEQEAYRIQLLHSCAYQQPTILGEAVWLKMGLKASLVHGFKIFFDREQSKLMHFIEVANTLSSICFNQMEVCDRYLAPPFRIRHESRVIESIMSVII